MTLCIAGLALGVCACGGGVGVEAVGAAAPLSVTVPTAQTTQSPTPESTQAPTVQPQLCDTVPATATPSPCAHCAP